MYTIRCMQQKPSLQRSENLLFARELIILENHNELREYFHDSNGIWGLAEGFDLPVFGFRCRSFLEGISMAFDGSENLKKGPLSTQIPLPRSMVKRGRIGVPGNFRVLEVRIA